VSKPCVEALRRSLRQTRRILNSGTTQTWEDNWGQNHCKTAEYGLDPLSSKVTRGHGKTWEDGFYLPRFFPKQGIVGHEVHQQR
jgi:hypothetical protein